MPLAPRERSDLDSEFPGRVIDEPGALARLGRDASHLVGAPEAAVAPRTTEEVVRLVHWARRHRRPLVPRGGGSSLDGESVAGRGSVVVDLSSMDRVVEVDPLERRARVEPGVINYRLHEALEAHALFFPPNPGSWTQSTIGGNASTNASGPRSFRYGSTRAWVVGAEVVLGSGEVVRLGGRTQKRSTGPGLLELLVGSEGTLGIFTELTVGLAPRPPRRIGLAVALTDALSLSGLVGGLRADHSLGLSAVEYVDRTCAAELARQPGSRLPGDAALLLLEVESASEDEESARLERLETALQRLGVVGDPHVYPGADQLWTLRGSAGTALAARVGPTVREDIAVPLRELDALVLAVDRIARDAGVPVHTFGHLGEANLHPNFVVDPSGPVAGAIRTRLYDETRRLGGTVSGEHGIGVLKAPYLELELGAGAVALLRSVKRACDPEGILNPGKLYPSE